MHLEKKTTLHDTAGSTHVNARLRCNHGIEIDISMFPSTDNLDPQICKAKVERLTAALIALSDLLG